jgi:hypothetical protein
MKRQEHLFQFTGTQISEAAAAEHDYHGGRVAFWKKEQDRLTEEAKKSGIKVDEVQVTGGKQVRMYVDGTIDSKLSLAGSKINAHQKAADDFQIQAACYGTQPERTYELQPDDVIYFRLAGGPREE